MAIFVLLLIGFALMFGAKGLAKSLVVPFLGLVLVLSLLPAFLNSCLGSSPGRGTPSVGVSGGGLLAYVLLAVVGYVLWRRRRAASHPDGVYRRPPRRERALPPPPAGDAWSGSSEESRRY